jgi:hypothetical protein
MDVTGCREKGAGRREQGAEGKGEREKEITAEVQMTRSK